MKIKYDNSERLETVSDKQWREALDHLIAYLRWRLKGRTRRGAHSEKALGMPAIDYYEEMAVVKLIEGEWKWQERFSLANCGVVTVEGEWRDVLLDGLAGRVRVFIDPNESSCWSFGGGADVS